MRYLLACLLAAGVSGAMAAEPENPDEKLPKPELLRHLADDVLLPFTANFDKAATQLSAAAKQYCAGSSGLDTVRGAWRGAQAAWQPLEAIQMGPVIERRTQRQVNAWPVRPAMVQSLWEDNATIDAARLEEQGVSGKGLPAIEYLLFPSEAGTAFKPPAPGSRQCEALQAVAGQVETEARGLAQAWREPDGGFARQLREAGKLGQDGAFASDEQALSDIVNLLIAGIDGIKVRKIGKPLEKSEGEVSLERIESWRAGTSIDHIRANLDGFESVFFGRGADGIGMDDYLAGIGRPVLPRLVRQELDATRRALDTLRSPLQKALKDQRAQVEAVHKGLEKLQRRMENEIADALKVDLGFNANDGD